MDSCFVIQPFDNAGYDQRYDQVYKTAIEEGGFKPYRVDRDPTASIPIHNIERGVKDSTICFADISEDNPNVWFELGLAIAFEKEICIVCSESRARFPFDVQHRLIIKYRTSAPSDFAELKIKIVRRIKAMADTIVERAKLPEIIDRAQQSADELAEYEIACMGILASSPNSVMSPYDLRREMSANGYNDLATNTSVRRLQKRKYIRFDSAAIGLLPDGWEELSPNLGDGRGQAAAV